MATAAVLPCLALGLAGCAIEQADPSPSTATGPTTDGDPPDGDPYDGGPYDGGPYDGDPSDGRPSEDGQPLEGYCASLMVGDVDAVVGPDGVDVTWRDGTARIGPTTYTVLRRLAASADGDGDVGWTTLGATELDRDDDRRYVDDDPTDGVDGADETVIEYAVTVDDPSCGQSGLCPEAAEACTSVTLTGVPRDT